MKHTESQIQIEAIKWLRLQYPDVRTIQSSTDHATTARQGRQKKLMGYQAGTPDLFIVHANHLYHGLFVEFKTDKGRQKPEQATFENYCRQNGYAYIICREVMHFVRLVKDYLNGEIVGAKGFCPRQSPPIEQHRTNRTNRTNRITSNNIELKN
jgi:hypothetical protein